MSDPFLPAPRFIGLDGQHHIQYEMPDERWAYVLTGTAQITFHAAGQDWTRGTVDVPIDLPGLPPGMGLSLIHWAPLVTLASVTNDNVATNAAWAVDRFALSDPGLSRRFVTVSADLAVRDADGYILRLGYCVHLLGTLAPDQGDGLG